MLVLTYAVMILFDFCDGESIECSNMVFFLVFAVAKLLRDPLK